MSTQISQKDSVVNEVKAILGSSFDASRPAADVQRVMKKYFTNANRLVIYYLPESAKTNTAPATGKKSREQGAPGEQGEQARAGTAGKEQKAGGRAK